MKKTNPKRGATLLITVFCLCALSILSILFAKYAFQFGQASSNTSAYLSAKMMAQAALEYAITQIPHATMDVAYDDPTRKHQFGDGKETPPPDDPKYPDAISVPVEDGWYFINPSFKIGDHTPPSFAYSLEKLTELYDGYATLKVIDANALLSINSPLPSGVTDLTQLQKTSFGKLLKNLLESITFPKLTPPVPIDFEAVRNSILTRRSTQGEYKRLADLGHLESEKLLRQPQLDRLCRYLTIHNWADKKAVEYDAWTHTARAPVNINLAPKPMLMAVLKNIAGSATEALADEIMTYRKTKKGFKNWNEVEKFFQDSTNISKSVAHRIFANIYPGILWNDYDPDEFHYRPTDKRDLASTEGTTEFCLFSPGIFQIESLGRIVSEGHTVIARAKLCANIKLWEPHLLNRQKNFNQYGKSPYKAWSSNTIALLNGKPNEYKPADNDFLGSLFEGNPEFATNGSSADQRVGCAFWFAKTDPVNRRVDGEFMDTGMKVEPTGSYAIQNSFELWLKPRKIYNKEQIVIMRKCEAGNGGTIITRCAYEPKLAGGSSGGLVLTRTLVITNTSEGGPVRHNARVFYGDQLNSKGSLKPNLMSTGEDLYYQILDSLQQDYMNTDSHVVPIVAEENAFEDKYARKVFGAYGGDANTTQSFTTKYLKKTFNWDTMEFEETEITVTVQCHTVAPWSLAKVLSSEPKNKDFTVKNTFAMDIFGSTPAPNPWTRTYQDDGNETEGTQDIQHFPALGEHNDVYKQSRSELRIYREAFKPLHWYKITGAWTQDDIIVTSLTCLEQHATIPHEVTTASGEIHEPGIGGPIHIWRLKNASEYQKGHAHFLCTACTIYQSIGDDIRYRKTEFDAEFDCQDAYDAEPRDDKYFHFWFGVASWTSFEPSSKGEITVKADDKYFLRNGANEYPQSTNPKYPMSPLYRNVLYEKKDGAVNKTSKIAFHINLPGGTNYLETSIFSHLLFYLLVNPEVMSLTELTEDGL